MSWYTLESINESCSELVARFVPDHFVADERDPVLVLTLRGPSNRQVARDTLERLQGTWIVDYSVTATSFSVLSDVDWKESVVDGETVDVAFQPYSAEELHRIARGIADQYQSESRRHQATLHRLDHVEHFVADQIARAQARCALSTRQPIIEARLIDVLQRVLHRTRETGDK